MTTYEKGFEDGLEFSVKEVCHECQEKLNSFLGKLRARRHLFQKQRILLVQD